VGLGGAVVAVRRDLFPDLTGDEIAEVYRLLSGVWLAPGAEWEQRDASVVDCSWGTEYRDYGRCFLIDLGGDSPMLEPPHFFSYVRVVRRIGIDEYILEHGDKAGPTSQLHLRVDASSETAPRLTILADAGLFLRRMSPYTKLSGPGLDNPYVEAERLRSSISQEYRRFFAQSSIARLTVEGVDECVMTALAHADFASLADHVHPILGLLFSPSHMADPWTNPVFMPGDLPDLLRDERRVNWGLYRSTSYSVELTPLLYYQTSIHDPRSGKDLLGPGEVFYNEFVSADAKNILDTFGESAIVVERDLTSRDYLIAVFVPYGERLYLSALLSDVFRL